MTIKQPAETSVVPNPLHKYASYSYCWSLWWLDVKDFNALMSAGDVTSALAWKPGPNSYVMAEDSGLYPDRRHPSTLGLNYHIQDVQFKTAIGPNQISKSSNLLSGSMTILEPYGVTFIDSLVAASFDGTRFTNYVLHPMMLQLEFKGYDDKGNFIPESQTVLHKKRFPIVMKKMKLSVTGKGAEYKIDFAPASAQGLDPEFEKTPQEFSIVAGTVAEFFEALSVQYFKHQVAEVATGRVDFAENIKFDIDPTIANSKIVYDKQVPLTLANPNVKNIKLDQTTFAIPKGTSILDVITRVMAQSEYLINLQLGLEEYSNYTDNTKDQTKIFNAFKTLTSVEYQGVDAGGSVRNGVYDSKRTRRPMTITYKIHQYPTWNGSSPAVPLFPNSIPYTVKDYNYLYTGKNVDIVDLKLDFNTTFYTAVNTYNSQFSATESSENTDKDIDKNLSGVLSMNPSVIGSIFVPQLNLVPSATPMRYKHVIGDANSTTGMNIKNRPAAQVAADVIKSIYSSSPTGNGDMLKVQLTIVGDSTLLKQDDWLYIPSPAKSAEYNSWDSQSQSQFVAKYGHIRMDAGQVVVRLTVNTPLDIDTDITNQGLVFPQPNTRPALFSGQYYIIHIDSKFVGGKFEQVLHLSRYLNTDYVRAFSQNKQNERSGDSSGSENSGNGVGNGIQNDSELIPTDTTTPASEESIDNTPVPLDPSLSPGERQALLDSTPPWEIEVNADPRQ